MYQNEEDMQEGKFHGGGLTFIWGLGALSRESA